MKCTNCDSDHIQSLEVVISLGTTQEIKNTSGVGVSHSAGGLGIGIGVAQSNSYQRSFLVDQILSEAPTKSKMSQLKLLPLTQKQKIWAWLIGIAGMPIVLPTL